MRRPTTAQEREVRMPGKYRHAYERDGVVYVYGRVNKKTHRLSTGKRVSAAAMAWAEREWKTIILEKIAPDGAASACPTVEEFGLRSLASGAGMRKNSTNKEYMADFKNRVVPLFGSVAVNQVTPLELRAWQSGILEGGASTARLKNIRKVFSLVLSDAVLEGLIEKNPFDLVKKPAVRHKAKRPFSLEEVRTLINNASGWFRDFLIVSFFTGMRTGEAMALEWRHINLHSRKIVIEQSMRNGELGSPKTMSGYREIDMLPPVEQALKARYLDSGLKGGPVFVAKHGGALAYAKNLRDNHWAPLLKKCLMDHRELYTTRHTFASIMLSQGEDPLWVSKMLGHSNLAITLQTYAKYIEKGVDTRARFLDGFSLGQEKAGRVCTQVAQSLHTRPKIKIG